MADRSHPFQNGSARLVGLSLEHPSASERMQGVESYARLTISRNLNSGKLDDVPLSEDELVKLLADAANCLKTLRGLR